MAFISFARVLQRSSHAACLVAQLFLRFALNLVSSATASVVLDNAPSAQARNHAQRPRRALFVSMAFPAASISNFFEVMRVSYVVLLSASDFSVSARSASMVSFICSTTPMIVSLPRRKN